MKKLFLGLMTAALLAGCATGQQATRRSEMPIIHPEEPRPVEVKPVQFKVWTYEELQQQAADRNNQDNVFYVLDEAGVKDLNDNILDTIRYIEQSKNNNKYYRDSIDSYNKSVRDGEKAAAPKEEKKSILGF